MARTDDRDAPLAEDIRLPGRLLGDTIRDPEGEFTFDLVETIRQLAVASRRLEDIASRRALAQTLDALTDDQVVAVVRAFSYFSLLANIAEDRHHIRRHRVARRSGTRPLASTLRGLFAEIAERGMDRDTTAELFSRIRVAPVLTAHPTEVQRKSTLDAQLAIAAQLGILDGPDLLAAARADHARRRPARRAFARPLAKPRRRALSPRAHRHLRAPRGDRRRARAAPRAPRRGRRRGAVSGRRRLQRGPRCDRPEPARGERRAPRRWPIAPVAESRATFRVSPGGRGPAAELRSPRGGRGGAPAQRRRGPGLRKPHGRRAAPRALRGARLAAPAAHDLRDLFGLHPGRTGDLRGRGRRAPAPRARRDSPMHHLQDQQCLRSPRGGRAAEGGGAGEPGRASDLDAADRAVVRNHRRPAVRAGNHAGLVLAPGGAKHRLFPRPAARGDARLFG